MKKWVRYSHLLTTVRLRAEVADPSPPYSQPDRKISIVFWTTPLSAVDLQMYQLMQIHNCVS